MTPRWPRHGALLGMAKPQHAASFAVWSLVAVLAISGCQPSSSAPQATGAGSATRLPSTATSQTNVVSQTGASSSDADRRAAGTAVKGSTGAPTSAAQGGHTAAELAAATAILGRIPIGGRGAKTGYLRTVVFGRAWVDVNANGCGTRDDILTRDLAGVGKRNGCVVVSGLLHDPYTGKAITFRKADASAVQIDHVVPLGLAWQLGAAQWSQGKRVSFANDPANLLAVDGSANESKSDSGPDSWLPPNKAYRCTYVIHFASVAHLYGLRITSSMRDTITAQLHTCTTVIGDPAGLKALPSSDWTRAARIGGGSGGASAPATTAAPPARTTTPASTGGDAYYANCAAVRAAGKAPLDRGQPGYRPGLDRDGDGVACE
jgi:hypothetical protein